MWLASIRAPLRGRGADARADGSPHRSVIRTRQISSPARKPSWSVRAPQCAKWSFRAPEHPELVGERSPVAVHKPVAAAAVNEWTAEVRRAPPGCSDGYGQRPHCPFGVSRYEVDDLVATLNADMDVLVTLGRSGGMPAAARHVVALDRYDKR